MIHNVFLPALGETMTEARIVRWLKQEGDALKKGEPILEIETDKATIEVESLNDGFLRKIVKPADTVVPVGDVIALVTDSPEEPLAQVAAPASATPAVPVAEKKDSQGAAPQSPAATPTSQAAAKLIASPRARRLADRSHIAIAALAGRGTGPGGRIVEADVQKYLAGLKAAPAAAPAQPPVAAPIPAAAPLPGDKVLPLTTMRKAIAEQMVRSVQAAPHVTFSADIDMSTAQQWHARANQWRQAAGQSNISLTALIVKVCAWALQRHPLMNASFQGNQVLLHGQINLGIAVALDEGLIVPVLKDVPTKGLAQIAEEIADLSQRARSNQLKASELSGGTFTVSNLGMFGVDRFTAIINPPEAGILAVGRIARRFVPDANDQPVAKPIMTVTLSADHRVVDGAVAARFLADIRAGLEEPSLITL